MLKHKNSAQLGRHFSSVGQEDNFYLRDGLGNDRGQCCKSWRRKSRVWHGNALKK